MILKFYFRGLFYTCVMQLTDYTFGKTFDYVYGKAKF